MTKPRIFNFVKPPDTNVVETEDLAPGERKCTERAHTGADTEFTRTITSAEGEETNEVWESHYKPWQEVCLLGVEPGTLKQPEEEVEPTNTNANINSNTNLNVNGT